MDLRTETHKLEDPVRWEDAAISDLLDDALRQSSEGLPINWKQLFSGWPELETEARPFLESMLQLKAINPSPKKRNAQEFRSAFPKEENVDVPDRFQIVEEIGSGGFATVFLARDKTLLRFVALKTVGSNLSAPRSHPVMDALREDGRRIAAFSHPNIVQVFDFHERPNPTLVLEYIPGGSLLNELGHLGPLPWQRACLYGLQVGRAVSHLHQHQLVHRDIKPANILLDRIHDVVKLTDFGLAAHFKPRAPVGGTPLYMAPEAFQGEISSKVDVFAIAATLFELVTGERPFSGNCLKQIQEQVSRGLSPNDPRWHHFPEDVAEILRLGLLPAATERLELEDLLKSLDGAMLRHQTDTMTPSNLRRSEMDGHLEIQAIRKLPDGTFEPIGSTPMRNPAPSEFRGIQRVESPLSEVCIRTGDQIRLTIRSTRAGSLVVFNLDSLGNLNLLFPDEDRSQWGTITAGETLKLEDLEVVLPTGRERVIGIRCRDPRRLDLSELISLSVEGKGESHAQRNMRGIVRLKKRLAELPLDSWTYAALELNHV